MSQGPIPEPPSIGEIRYFDSIKPPLTQGDYKIEMKQEFPPDIDTISTGMNQFEYLNKFFTVNGSRWSIDPLTIHARFPPKNEQNVKLDCTLPKIVFQSKTLPWERIVSEQNKDIPWMSLLLIRDDEFGRCDYYPIAESTEIDSSTSSVPIKLLEIPANLLKSIAPTLDEVELLAHGLQVNPRDKELCGNDEDGLFSVVLSNRIPSVPNEKYHAFLVSLEGSLNELPEENEIRYLTKPPVRKDAADRSLKFAEASKLSGEVNEIQSQSMSYQQTPGTDFTPGYMADATPSGMIAGGSKSIAGGSKSIAGVSKAISSSGSFQQVTNNAVSAIVNHFTHKVKLVVLDYWKFKTGDGGDFESKIRNIRFRKKEDNLQEAGELGSVYDFAKEKKEDSYYEPALLGNDMDPDISANSYLLTDIVEDDGITRPCLYRGPCIAVPTTHQPKSKPYENSDDARGIEPSTGLDVIHHSAAFELGRLLAMSDPQFVSSVSRWRRLLNKKEAMKIYREDTFKESGIAGKLSPNQYANESVKTLLQTSIISKASEKYRDIVAERMVAEDTIQFANDLVNPGVDGDVNGVRINRENNIIDDTIVSDAILNQFDDRRLNI